MKIYPLDLSDNFHIVIFLFFRLFNREEICSNKGCNETDTVLDDKSEKKKHDLKTVTVKKATKTADGLAEIKCSLCGYVEKKVTITKGKDVEDVISKNDTSGTNSGVKEQSTNSNNESVSNESSIQEQDTSSNASGTVENSADTSTSGSKSNRKIPWLIIILIAVLVLISAAIGVWIFFVIKKLMS